MAKRKGGPGSPSKPPARNDNFEEVVLPLSDEVAALMETQLDDFREKFGREPGPGDPIFFDPDADEPTPLNPHKMTAIMVVSMIKAGLGAEMIYCSLRTGGLILSEDSEEIWSEEDLADWDAASAEYQDIFGGGEVRE